MTVTNADPASTAAPGPLAGSAAPWDVRALRRTLADSISDRDAADAAVRVAKDTLSRAEARLQSAIDAARRIKADLDRSASVSTGEAARAILEALRAGREPPAIAVPMQPESPALAAATAERNALQVACLELEAELRKAQDAANAAAAVCRDLVDAIMTAEGRDVARQWIAAVEVSWQLQDRLTGLARVRGGALLPDAEQTSILEHVDRRKAAISANRRMIEDDAWRGHLDAIQADQERLWLDYGRRLMLDASATMEPVS